MSYISRCTFIFIQAYFIAASKKIVCFLFVFWGEGVISYVICLTYAQWGLNLADTKACGVCKSQLSVSCHPRTMACWSKCSVARWTSTLLAPHSARRN